MDFRDYPIRWRDNVKHRQPELKCLCWRNQWDKHWLRSHWGMFVK